MFTNLANELGPHPVLVGDFNHLENEFVNGFRMTSHTLVYIHYGEKKIETTKQGKLGPQFSNLCGYGPLPVISTYNPIYRMYNPIEITSYN